MQRQRGHVVAKDDLFRAGGIVEVGHRRMRFVQYGIGFLTGGKRAAVVGIVLGQVGGHAVKRLLSDLGTAGVIEENHAFMLLQSRELAADGGQVKRHRVLQKKLGQVVKTADVRT